MAQKKSSLPADQAKIVGKMCTICYQLIKQEDVERGDYVSVRTKRATEISMHKHCFHNQNK